MELRNEDKTFGRILKKGTLNVQCDNEEWVKCEISVREQGITLVFLTKDKYLKTKIAFDVVIEFSSNQEVGIVMLPDNARRSRESKIFPFIVKKRTIRKRKPAQSGTMESVTDNKILHRMYRNEIILGTSNGREMWEWASCIRWLGINPTEEKIPFVPRASTINSHDKYYEDAEVLQDVLLKMFTYKNLPKEPIVTGHNNAEFYGNPHHRELADEFIENQALTFQMFAYSVLVGACVHVNEKCFELITSSNLYNISSLGVERGNTPLSMLCEGDYNTSRNFMIQALWRLGHPDLEGYYACGPQSFSTIIAKPVFLAGAGNALGLPVHPDDQKLCRYLRDKGDGRIANKILCNQLLKASEQKATSFESEHRHLITEIIIPKSIMDWGSTHLTMLNLAHNGIFELPEELYDFTALTSLNVSYNCLFELSHRLGNLTNLKDLDISMNLIEELPYTIELLEKITVFKCSYNPIKLPPSGVWSRGINEVRMFFRDGRESGTEINRDLKVLVLGQSEAGKTSLINGLINPRTKALTRVGDRTVGIEKRTWVMKENEKIHPINMLMYDFAGQEEYYITHHLFLGSKALYIIAFDLSKYEPRFLDRQIMLWWDSIQNRVCNAKSNDSKTPKVILVGTHADAIENAQSIANDIKSLLQKRFQLRMDGLKTRLEKLNKELEDLDPRKKKEKGTELSLSDADKKKKYEMLSTEDKIQIIALENEEKKLRHQQQYSIALPTVIPAVSSKNMQNFDKLKEQISLSLEEIGPSGKYFPHLNVPVPRAWCQIRRFVRQQSILKGRECMKLPQYFKLLSNELGIVEDVGRRGTYFCHDLGDVLFFEKEDLVFLQPSFLIDTFKCIIRHDHKESTYWTEKLLDHGITEEQFDMGKHSLLQKGELDFWLLKALWSEFYNNLDEANITNNLIQLLETFDIATSIDNGNKKIIVIPEFQPKTLVASQTMCKNDGDFEIQRLISVDGKLPHGLLKRVQVKILKKIYKRIGAKEMNLAQNEIYISDINSTKLYLTSGRNEDYTGCRTSEGVRLYIQGKDKSLVMSLLSKVCACMNDVFNEFPGLIFDHYVVYTTHSGLSFHKLEEVEAFQAAGRKQIHTSIQTTLDGPMSSSVVCDTEPIALEIDDLLPPLPNFANMKK